jgi:hypothetical protein
MAIQRGQRRKSNFSADNPVDARAGIGIHTGLLSCGI